MLVYFHLQNDTHFIRAISAQMWHTTNDAKVIQKKYKRF